MKIQHVFFIILSLLFIGSRSTDNFPEAVITNDAIKARIYLPDAKNGYYRASRFDWSGVIPELEYKGHTYFGQWFDKYSPTIHDAIMGPVEDFLPVGYEEAKTGDNFLKIGIGLVTKPEESKYSIVTPYQIKNGGEWRTKKKKDEVAFIHTLKDDVYAYEYVKVVRLLKGKPELIIEHSLKNKGKKSIETDVYEHNFFVIDKQPVGADFVVSFPFNLSGQPMNERNFGKLEDNKIVFLKDLARNSDVHYPFLTGFSNTAKDYDIKVENRKTGAGVRITADQPMSRLGFWSAPKTLCPEPYIQVKAKPGETFRWKISYQFYTNNISN